MDQSRKVFRLIIPALLFLVFATDAAAGKSWLNFVCAEDNDLYRAVGKHPRFEDVQKAFETVPTNSVVLVLADGYPVQRTKITPAQLALAASRKLGLYVEYPEALPGLEFGKPRTAAWERLVLASDRFSPELQKLRILMAHECEFLPVNFTGQSDIVIARVAGYDTAVFGLPMTNVWPILFELPDSHVLVATTRLSDFVRGRFAPAMDWQLLWTKILASLAPQETFSVRFKDVVQPVYARDARLPRKFEKEAFTRAADWFTHAGLLVHPADKAGMYRAIAAGTETTAPPPAGIWEGDGSLGILEGYESGIAPDGSQKRRLPLRADCNCESAMVLALDSTINGRAANANIASNLLDFVYFNSGMCKGVRGDPKQAAFGLIGWGDLAPAWLVANYGDDNACAMLATMTAGAALKTDRWDGVLMRALLANFRTTGKFGFRGDRLDLPVLAQNGWRHFYDAGTINYSPHFESLLWACYLWGYRQTGFKPFLERTRTGMEMMMKVYPEKWRWQDNLERAHILLSLAWLVRVDDTPQHRAWLDQVASDLLKDQTATGSIHERLGTGPGGHYRVPMRNEDYGTTETPLLQQNGDPVSDQLYTTGFALLGLHEAYAATGDSKFKDAEDKLAEYLCRIQTRSSRFAYLDGTWFRAFDDARWEAWASSADAGWGAWSLEAGWGQSWTAAVLGLRIEQRSLWDFTTNSRVSVHFPKEKTLLELSE